MTSPADLDQLTKQAKQHVRRSEFAQAIELFRQALALDEKRIDLHEGLATALFLSAHPREAAEHFVRITQLDPRQGKASINLGAVYNRMGEYQKAVEALRRGMRKEKNCSQGYYNLGIAHRGLNQLSMAVSAYREALRLDPQMAEAHQNLANVYLEMGNTQQAIAHYRQALEIQPEFERAKHGLARAEEAAAKVREAVNPLGRLMDEKRSRARPAPQTARKLTEDERRKDRKAIHGLSVEIKTAADAWLAQLKEEFEPRLMALNRAVAAQGTEPKYLLTAAREGFQEAFQRYVELRRPLKRKMLELRAHEELVHTPDLEPPG